MTEPTSSGGPDARRPRRRRRRGVDNKPANERTHPSVTPASMKPNEDSRSRDAPKGRERKNGVQNDAARRNGDTGLMNGTRPRYSLYWTEDTAMMKLQLGQCFSGTLRINSKGSLEGYITLPDFSLDIMLRPGNFQNRAIGGDEVVYRILPTAFWWREKSVPRRTDVQGVPFPTEGDMGFLDGPGRRMGILRKEIHIAVQLRKRGEMERLQLPVIWDHVESPEEAKALLKEVLLYFPEMRPTAEVVRIAKPSPSREALVGVLQCNPKIPQLVYLIPLDPALPKRFIVSSESMRLDWNGLLTEASMEESEYRTLVKAVLSRWDAHDELPIATITDVIGSTNDIEKQTVGILKANHIEEKAFEQEVLDCLPDKNWMPSDDDLHDRWDFRKTCVFSIDPPTARDLDDALSIERIGDDRFRVGVHIADVSFFVKSGSALDRAAQKRTTSVYLVQRVIPMLPELLSSHLCSLNPGQDRLTFSVVWEMNGQGEVFKQHVQKSIIHSAAKLAYDHAQSVIEDPSAAQPENVTIHGGHTWSKIRDDILTLFEISQHLKQKRFDGGALRLDLPKIGFRLDEGGLPKTAEPAIQKEANNLIQEFMLLANMTVAKLISDMYPSHSLLRCHPPPNLRLMGDLMDIAEELHVSLDLSTAGAIQRGLRRLYEECNDADVIDVITNIATRPMQLAEYFCTGITKKENWVHYALAVECYTHFTSPIRRYPDIIVHRLLHAALTSGEEFREKMDREASHKMQTMAEACNRGKLSAKNAQDASLELFLRVWLEKKPVETIAVVASVKGSKFFDIYVPQFGLPYRIVCAQLPGNIVSKFDPMTSTLTLSRKSSPECSNTESQVQDSLPPENGLEIKRLEAGSGERANDAKMPVRVLFDCSDTQSVSVVFQAFEQDDAFDRLSEPVHVDFQYSADTVFLALHVREPAKKHQVPVHKSKKDVRINEENTNCKVVALQFPFKVYRFSKIPIRVWAQRDLKLGVVKDIKVDLVIAYP